MWPVCAGEVCEYEREADAKVDDVERVGDEVEDEVVGVSAGRREDDDERDDHVPCETDERRVARPVGGEELGEGNDTVAAECLVETALGEDDAEDVGGGRECDEGRQGARGLFAKHVLEVDGGGDFLAGEELLLGDGSVVGNLDEEVYDGDEAEGERTCKTDGASRVLDLASGIVEVGVAYEAPDSLLQVCVRVVLRQQDEEERTL